MSEEFDNITDKIDLQRDIRRPEIWVDGKKNGVIEQRARIVFSNNSSLQLKGKSLAKAEDVKDLYIIIEPEFYNSPQQPPSETCLNRTVNRITYCVMYCFDLKRGYLQKN